MCHFLYRYYYGALAWLVLYLLMLPSMAAEPSSPEINPPPLPSAGGGSFTHPFIYLTSPEFFLSLLVLIFGVVTLGFEYALMRTKSFDSNDVLKVLAVTLIVVSTLFVITAGFSSQQIAPAMGLFGTVAGYLLGRSSQKPCHNKEKTDE